MSITIKIILSLVGIILFLIGVFVVRAANAKPVDRYRQLLSPIVALLYGVVIIIFFNQCDNLVGIITDSLLSVAPGLVDAGQIIEVTLFNFLFLLLFVVVKGIYRGIINRLVRPYEKRFKRFIGIVYLYDDTYQHWYLKAKYLGFRTITRNLFICAVVISAVLFFCTGVFASEGFAIFYPAFAVLILGELYYCLSGVTKEEYLQKSDFEESEPVHIFQYAKLEELLEHYFGDRILQTGLRSASNKSAGTHDDFCQHLISSDDYRMRLAGGYFKALVDKGIVGNSSDENKRGVFGQLNHDMVLDTVRLLQGKSVMFASQFCRDFIPYLFLPMNTCLMHNDKVLVLYGSEVSEEVLLDYINEGLEFVTSIPHMWTVDSFDNVHNKGDADSDVVLLPFSSLGNVRGIIDNAEFLSRIGFVVVIDPSSLLATYQIGLNFLAEYMTGGCPVNYCIFDRNADGLVDSLSHALRTNLTEIAATEFSQGSSVGLFWEADGASLQHRLLSGIAQYLGVGIEIGLVALKGQVRKVTWASRSAVPVVDQRWIAGQYYGDLLRFADLPQEQLQIDEHFEFCTDVWSLEKQENRFLVVEDEYRNLFEAFRQFSTRGVQQSFINVLSPNYLLRSYMIDNNEMFLCDPKAIPAFAPDFSKSERNIIFSIVMAMVQSGRLIIEDEIVARLKYAGLPVTNVKEALEGLLIDHIDIADDFSGILPEQHVIVNEVEEYVPARREIVTRRYYGLEDQAQYSECFASLRNVPLVTEQSDGTELLLGSRLYGHVYQSYLPGQFVVINGKYYEVVSISTDAGVILRRAADHFSRRRYYRQLRSYTISEWQEGENLGDIRTISDIVVKRIAASVIVKTQGYIDLSDFGNLKDAQRVELSNIPDRRYRNKSALRMEFSGASEQVTLTLAVLISELLVTLFPQDYSYLAVVTPCGELLQEGILYSCEGDCEEGVIYIIEDSLIDIGLVSSIDRNIQRILEICWDYLDWHQSMLNKKFVEEPEWDLGELPEFNPPEVKKNPVQRIIGRVRDAFGHKDEAGDTEDVGENKEGETIDKNSKPDGISTSEKIGVGGGEDSLDGEGDM